MIKRFNIGIDIVKVKKFEDKPFSKNKIFYKKIFLESEIRYCLKYKNSAERFAGKFALKEAVIKSLDKKINFSEIETSHLKSKPIVNLKKFDGKYDFISSLSHEKDFSIAVVICQKIK